METVIRETLGSLTRGDAVEYKNMAVIPLFSKRLEGPEYLTLKKALMADLISVSEISAAGSVPELKVISRSDIPILLLDGEELEGAKQNRVLNTSILLKENSETVIPVSCTEAGRWAYTSRDFKDSGTIFYSSARAAKMKAVSHSLDREQAYRSNQAEVWETVSHAASSLGSASPTGAMKDIYRDRSRDLNSYRDHFPLRDGQKGLAVLIGGRPAGFDLLSRESAYADLHDKLVKSYAIDALIRDRRRRGRNNESGEGKTDESRMEEAVTRLIEKARGCREKKYPSVGYGDDFRFKETGLVGSSLVYRETAVHTAFFTDDRSGDSDENGRISGLHRRRRYRGM